MTPNKWQAEEAARQMSKRMREADMLRQLSYLGPPAPTPDSDAAALHFGELGEMQRRILETYDQRVLREHVFLPYLGGDLHGGPSLPEDRLPPQRKAKRKYEPAPMPTDAEIDAVMAQIRNGRRKP